MAQDAIYVARGGETLEQIASAYTLHPNYAIGIARSNGFREDQTRPDYRMVQNETITIPRNWLKPQYQDMEQLPTLGPPLPITVTGAGRYAKAPFYAEIEMTKTKAESFNWIPLAIIGGVLLLAGLVFSGTEEPARKRKT
jgi:hypothetical protein